jgi:endonuclease/exonuclease/phosphatase family metal-dependent hydrolase
MLACLVQPGRRSGTFFDVGVPLRVVSYNVHSLRDDRGALAAVARSLEPDVMIVQEAPRRFRWRTKCAQLAHSFGLFYAAGGLPSLGNLILTNLRVRVLETWELRYPLIAGRHMRGAVFARCAVPGADPFVIAGSHLSTYDGERPVQAGLLMPALGAAADPVILGIDLNETDDGDSWRLLAGGLVDSGRDGGDTFPAGAPDRRIDAILADPRIGITRFEVVRSPEALRASDHLPLVADLTLSFHGSRLR